MKKENNKNYGANVLTQGHRCHRCSYEWKANYKQKLPKVCSKCKSLFWDKPKTNGESK